MIYDRTHRSDLKASPLIELLILAEKSRRYNFVNIDQGEPAMLTFVFNLKFISLSVGSTGPNWIRKFFPKGQVSHAECGQLIDRSYTILRLGYLLFQIVFRNQVVGSRSFPQYAFKFRTQCHVNLVRVKISEREVEKVQPLVNFFAFLALFQNVLYVSRAQSLNCFIAKLKCAKPSRRPKETVTKTTWTLARALINRKDTPPPNRIEDC